MAITDGDRLMVFQGLMNWRGAVITTLDVGEEETGALA